MAEMDILQVQRNWQSGVLRRHISFFYAWESMQCLQKCWELLLSSAQESCIRTRTEKAAAPQEEKVTISEKTGGFFGRKRHLLNRCKSEVL